MQKFYFLLILLIINLHVNAFSIDENDVTKFTPESMGFSSTELEKLDHAILKRIENGDILEQWLRLAGKVIASSSPHRARWIHKIKSQ